MKFKGAEVMTGRRSTIRQARLWARLLARIAPEAQPDDVALHMGAPPRWRALFGRTVLRCYRAELARASQPLAPAQPAREEEKGSRLTADHILTQTRLQGIELRPPGAIPLSAAALAQRMGVSVASAYRMIAATAAAQHDPAALRVVRLPVVTGKGARRDALHILWPVH